MTFQIKFPQKFAEITQAPDIETDKAIGLKFTFNIAGEELEAVMFIPKSVLMENKYVSIYFLEKKKIPQFKEENQIQGFDLPAFYSLCDRAKNGELNLKLGLKNSAKEGE